jgi:hypothetical protein
MTDSTSLFLFEPANQVTELVQSLFAGVDRKPFDIAPFAEASLVVLDPWKTKDAFQAQYLNPS